MNLKSLTQGTLRPVGWFIGLACLLSWACWIPVAIARQNAINTAFVLLTAVGMFGPSAAGLYLTWREEGRAGLRALLRRALSFGFAGRWWAVVLLTWPILFGLAAFIASRTGSSPYPYSPLGKLLEAQPFAILPHLLISLLIGAISEEYGWRGYAQDRLQASWGQAGASLWLGLFWGLWQLPLFFMVGTTQSNLSLPLYLAFAFPFSVLVTWVYNGSGRSLGAVIIFHFMFNVTTGFIPLLDPVTFVSLFGLTLLAALGIGFLWRIRR